MTYIAVAFGIVLTMLAIPADALNGSFTVMSCACTTTADFASGATRQASVLWQEGTYMLTSTTNASTAIISITGFATNKPAPHWITTAAIPVDAQGNSLAGSSETYLEAYYASYDGGLFGWLRGESNGAVGKIAVPTSYQESFVCNCEVEDMAGQVAGWIQQQYPTINVGAMLSGTPVTLVFKDGSTAIFLRASAGSTVAFVWSGRATNSQHQAITDTHGTLLNPPKPTVTGGGRSSGPPLPGGLPYYWTITGGNECYFSSFVELPDGSSFGSAGYGPC